MREFALDLAGGTAERRYRRQRPGIDALPWDALALDSYSEAERRLAQTSWLELALLEYAAVATQAHCLSLLLRAQAPLDLSALLSGFALDELSHTELCVRVAGAMGPVPALQYHDAQVYPAVPVQVDDPLLLASCAVAREFCVAESITQHVVRRSLEAARDPLLQAVWRRILRDEAQHAGLGWTFLQWARPVLGAARWSAVQEAFGTALAATAATEARLLRRDEAAYSTLSASGGPTREAAVAALRAACVAVQRRWTRTFRV